jgi:hypothetical protein
MPPTSRPFRTAAALGLAAAMGLALAPLPSLSLDSIDLVDDEDLSSIVTDPDVFAPQLVTVDTPTAEAKAHLTALGLDLTEHAGRDYVEVVLHTAEDLARLVGEGFTYQVRIEDMLAREVERVALDRAYAAAVEVSELPSGRTGYRVLDDFEREIDDLVARFPDLAKRISIGESVEGRDLTGIEIGRDVHAPEDGRPVFLMFGAHHAREWPSAELPMEFAYDLLEGYGTDERITDLLDRGRAIVVPVSNPDGYDASRTSGDIVDLREVDNGGIVSILATPGNAYKRKNCRYVDGQTQPAGTCVLAPSNGGLGLGVDLNRNYGGLWGGPGASGDPTSAIYRGPAPFSEPETQAIRSLISNRQVTTLITNHTFSNLILRPVGVHPDTVGPDGNPVGFAPDECFTAEDGRDRGMQTLGERMAAHTGYSNQFGWELYDTTGTTEDYSYNATGGYGYTFEIGPDEFHPPFEEVVAEYTGDNDAARSVTPENAHELTTDAADDCAGDPHDHDHDHVGGGNREAFLVAFENAIDAATHSVIRGTAPAGATLTLERTGVFPLWDRSFVADTVSTAMVVGEDGSFAYHANPSTRPFVQSRKAPLLGEPKESFAETGFAAPLSTTSSTFEVTEPADLIRATVRTTIPVDGQVVSYAQFHLRLFAPDGTLVAQGTEFGPINSVSWMGPEGDGIPTGTYTLQVSNSIAATSLYDLEAATQDLLSDHTARRFEQWTMSCITEDGLLAQAGVSVERGQSVDVGDVCNVLGEQPDTSRKPKKDTPGKGNKKP